MQVYSCEILNEPTAEALCSLPEALDPSKQYLLVLQSLCGPKPYAHIDPPDQQYSNLWTLVLGKGSRAQTEFLC